MNYYDELNLQSDCARRVGWTGKWQQFALMEIVRAIVEPTDSIVDIGCGEGALFAHLEPKPQNYIGYDRFIPFVEKARRDHGPHFENDELTVANFEGSLAIAVGTFDGGEQASTFATLLQEVADTAGDFVVICLKERVHWEPSLQGIGDTVVRTFAKRNGAIVREIPTHLIVHSRPMRTVEPSTHSEWLSFTAYEKDRVYSFLGRVVDNDRPPSDEKEVITLMNALASQVENGIPL